MEVELGLILNIVSFMLTIIILLVILFSIKNNTRRMRALKVFLAFLLMSVNIACGMLGSAISWGLALGWTIALVLNLVALS